MPRTDRSFKLSKRIRKVRSCPRHSPKADELRGADVCGVVRVLENGYVNLTVTEVRLRDGRRLHRGRGLEEFLVCASRSFAHRRGLRAVSPKSWTRAHRGVQLGAHVTLSSKHKKAKGSKVCITAENLIFFQGRRHKWVALQFKSDLFDAPEGLLHLSTGQILI